MWRVMPWDLTAFVGRQREREALEATLAADGGGPQLHSLSGIAGAGKTRLARVVAGQVAGAFPGGRIFCELDGGLEALAVELGAPGGDDTGERIGNALALRDRTLCVLDHAGAASSDLPAALPAWLSAGAHAFVVTSRAPLEVRGARRLELGPLDEADAIELLARRLEELGRPPIAEAVARRLVDEVGRLPLGIELCAGEPGAKPAQVATSQADVPERHRSLDRVAADIWRALDPDARHGLAVASTFDEDFTLADFAALGGESIEPLVRQGLVARAGAAFRVSRWLRELTRGRTPHRQVLVAERARRLLAEDGRSRPLELLRAGEAIEGWQPDLAARALLTAAEGLARAGHAELRRSALDRAIDLAGEPSARLARAELARLQGRLADARADLAALPEHWPPELVSRASRLAALLALDGGDPDAERLLDQAVAAATSDLERARSLAIRFAHKLVLATPPGDDDGVQAYDRFRASGEASEAAAVLANLGLAALHRGEEARGRDRLARAEAEAEAAGDRAALAGAHLFTGLADLAAGELEAAIARLARAEELALGLARWGLWSDAVGYGAVARLAAGRPGARAELASHVDELAGRGPGHARALFAAFLHLVDDARPPPDVDLARGRPLVQKAIEALRAAPADPSGLTARVADRVRRLLAGAAPPAPPDALVVSRDRRRFRVSGVEVDLSRRGAIQRVFAELVERCQQGMPPASPDQLVAAGWPGEVINPEAARLRLYNAVAALRAMGLRGLLVTSASGYQLIAPIAAI
jgi:hypothetical protein